MTEAEWLASEDPVAMLEYLATAYGRLSERKLRLFAAHCCRNVLHAESIPEIRRAVTMLELFAEGLITDMQFWTAHHPVDQIAHLGWFTFQDVNAVHSATGDGISHPLQAAIGAAWSASEAASLPCGTGGREAERRLHATWLRDIFPSPYRPKLIDRDWFRSNADTPISLAKGMYESRDFGAMPILADALQDAGCDSEDVLNHCRDPHAAHVRGCWVVDLVLGKS